MMVGSPTTDRISLIKQQSDNGDYHLIRDATMFINMSNAMSYAMQPVCLCWIRIITLLELDSLALAHTPIR